MTGIQNNIMPGRELMYKYWGKAKKKEDGTFDWHLLVYHCLDVAAVGRIIGGLKGKVK